MTHSALFAVICFDGFPDLYHWVTGLIRARTPQAENLSSRALRLVA